MMRIRLITLLVEVALLGLGVLVLLEPEQGLAARVLMRYWPVFLLLAGVVRVVGYLIDHHPRSPVGGLMLAAAGGILLIANLRGEYSLLYLFGQYWFWLLLAYIAGRVLRQYTYPVDRAHPRAFSFGAVVLMMLLVGCGLTANFLTKHSQYLNRLNVPLKFVE